MLSPSHARNVAGVRGTFIHFPNGQPGGPASKRGYQRIDQGIEFTSRDTWSADATTSFFDENGTPYFTGCARATGARLQ